MRSYKDGGVTRIRIHVGEGLLGQLSTRTIIQEDEESQRGGLTRTRVQEDERSHKGP